MGFPGDTGGGEFASESDERLELDEVILDSELVLPDEECERGGDGDGTGDGVSSASKRVSLGIGPKRAR